MKIAFCLHGLSSGLNFKEGGLPVTFGSEAKLFHKHLIDLNTTDCFFHTWESDFSENIIKTYNPKKFKVESTKVFVKPNFIDKLKYYINNKFIGVKEELHRVNNVYSRWYSFYESVKLVTDYEKETGVKYDYIFISRFDMSLFVDIKFENFNKSKFYCGDWYVFYDKDNNMLDEKKLFNNEKKFRKKIDGYPANDRGISDFWFFAERDLMVSFSKIYLELNTLIKAAGKSNHLIALEKLKMIGKEKDIEKFLEFGKDYYLSRWI